MNTRTLRELYEQHEGKVSDKWSIYLSEYDRFFSSYRNKPLRLLEIGIQNGGSLEVWGEYFPSASKIVGCDINPDCARLTYADPRVSVVVGDANSDNVEQKIRDISPAFDLIIDDGSHVSGDIVRSFARYFPRLADGGLFVAEDLHCSYWQSFQGGLFDPASSIAFFKRLADIVSHEHWGVPVLRKNVLASFMRKYDFDIDEHVLAHIHSVEFINSLCVIRKSEPAKNELGARFIAGTDASIVNAIKALHQSRSIAPNQHANAWTQRDQLPEDELDSTTTNYLKLQEQVASDAFKLSALRSALSESKIKAEEAASEQARMQKEYAAALQQVSSLSSELRDAESEVHKKSLQLFDVSNERKEALDVLMRYQSGKVLLREAMLAIARRTGLERLYLRACVKGPVARSGLFDVDYYLQSNPDVRASGKDPLMHFLTRGWLEGRDPSPTFSTRNYLTKYLDVYMSKVNPLVHFIKHGAAEGRLTSAASASVESAESQSRDAVLYRSLGVVPFYLDPFSDAEEAPLPRKIGIHLHLFYLDRATDCIRYLQNVPQAFDLFVSVPQGSDSAGVRSRFMAELPHLRAIEIREVLNRGRDLAPLIVEFGSQLRNYDLIAHVHSKKSVHREDGDAWFAAMMDTLFGSSRAVSQILRLFDGDAKVVYPGISKLPLWDSTGWSQNEGLAGEFLAQHTTLDVSDFPVIDFPQGSIFWADPSKLGPLLELPLSYEDFPLEPLPLDGTLAHALERLILVLGSRAPGRNYRIALPQKAAASPWYEASQDYSGSAAKDVKVLAYYLPQFHSTPENDEWHGPGFTEWHKAASCYPLFAGHYQQHVPHPDIGYYSLTEPAHLYKQAEMMRQSGVHGLVMYHYWFGGRMILENPAKMLLRHPDIAMPFCFCWANENWTRRWDGNEREILLGQKYSLEDARAFIEYLIPFFRDPRYIKVDGRPMLLVYRPASMELSHDYVRVWEEVCREVGLPKPYVVATLTRGATSPAEHGMEAATERVLHDWTDGAVPDIKSELTPYWPVGGSVLDYGRVADHYIAQKADRPYDYFRSLVSMWDNTPRYRSEAFLLHRFSSSKFQQWMEVLVQDARARLPEDRRFVLVNAWNEWAEGAHLEPDVAYGYSYLNCIGRALSGICYDDIDHWKPKTSAPTRIRLRVHPDVQSYFEQHPDASLKFATALEQAVRASDVELLTDEEGGCSAHYLLEFRRPCLFRPNALTDLIRAAQRFDGFGVCANLVNDPDFLSNAVEVDGAVADYWLRSGMNLDPVGGVSGYKLCHQVPCFSFALDEAQTAPSVRSQQPRVSTVVRYHGKADPQLLMNALYSLLVQSACAVKAWIGMQDVQQQDFDRLDAQIQSLPWEPGCQPTLASFTSEGGVGDLRAQVLNQGLRAQAPGYVGFMDYDDVLYAHAYDYLTQRLVTTGKAVAFGRVYTADVLAGTGRVLSRRPQYNYGVSYNDFWHHNHAPLHSFLLDTSKIDTAAIEYFPDMRYMEDYFMTLQIFTPDNADWDALKDPVWIGDYNHRIGAQGHTLALDDVQREALLSRPEYVLCQQRIDAIREMHKGRLNEH